MSPAEPAITVDGVSKKYKLFPSKRARIREALDPRRRSFHHEFWALRDISFTVGRGHTVGILGMNGSGKSTLLQIIASVLQPTTGTVRVAGKVAALLELGAGFNPDLTARENVVLHGTIMGLSRAEILDRMSTIEAFADIGEFFEQPMKTHSSGMFMRVAFATALYVDPEVLIIDEALSVGDARFQENARRFRIPGCGEDDPVRHPRSRGDPSPLRSRYPSASGHVGEHWRSCRYRRHVRGAPRGG